MSTTPAAAIVSSSDIEEEEKYKKFISRFRTPCDNNNNNNCSHFENACGRSCIALLVNAYLTLVTALEKYKTFLSTSEVKEILEFMGEDSDRLLTDTALFSGIVSLWDPEVDNYQRWQIECRDIVLVAFFTLMNKVEMFRGKVESLKGYFFVDGTTINELNEVVMTLDYFNRLTE